MKQKTKETTKEVSLSDKTLDALSEILGSVQGQNKKRELTEREIAYGLAVKNALAGATLREQALALLAATANMGLAMYDGNERLPIESEAA